MVKATTSEATREIDWQLSALETVPSITGLGSQWQFLFCKELVNHLLQLSDVGHSQEMKWALVHLYKVERLLSLGPWFDVYQPCRTLQSLGLLLMPLFGIWA